jgi:hypothetical protein
MPSLCATEFQPRPYKRLQLAAAKGYSLVIFDELTRFSPNKATAVNLHLTSI